MTKIHTNKKLSPDPVDIVENWKDAVDQDTQGMTEKQLNQYLQKGLASLIQRYKLKTT